MDYENIQVIDRASSNFKLRMKTPITYSERTTRIEQLAKFAVRLRNQNTINTSISTTF